MATSTTNAPGGRDDHTAVWTGSEMIVWGGWNGSNSFNTGGRYNPGTDVWTAMSTTNAPTARYDHTASLDRQRDDRLGRKKCPAIYFNTGGKYNPKAQTIGQPPARQTRPEAGLVTQQCGPEVT